MPAREAIAAYLSVNKSFALPKVPDRIVDFGKESLIVLGDIFDDLYRTQHSLMLDARRENDIKTSDYENNESKLLGVAMEIQAAIPQSKSNALLPILYEPNRQLDFSAKFTSDCNEPAADIWIGTDKKGSFSLRICGCKSLRRSYLNGISRRGLSELAYNLTFRELWIALLIKNSYAIRPFRTDFSAEQIRATFNALFNDYAQKNRP